MRWANKLPWQAYPTRDRQASRWVGRRAHGLHARTLQQLDQSGTAFMGACRQAHTPQCLQGSFLQRFIPAGQTLCQGSSCRSGVVGQHCQHSRGEGIGECSSAAWAVPRKQACQGGCRCCGRGPACCKRGCKGIRHRLLLDAVHAQGEADGLCCSLHRMGMTV